MVAIFQLTNKSPLEDVVVAVDQSLCLVNGDALARGFWRATPRLDCGVHRLAQV